VPADNLVKTIADYNAAVDARKTADEFGRVSLSRRIATGPWYAFPRKPAAHHTMGGVLIDEDGHALKADGSRVPGLYCAGEITGVVHGGNRLGGNAIVDFTVFGRIAGASAAAGK
jgi:fumarate reductase flavoprotein subunit